MALSVRLTFLGSFPSPQLRLIILNPLNYRDLFDWLLVLKFCLWRALQSLGLSPGPAAAMGGDMGQCGGGYRLMGPSRTDPVLPRGAGQGLAALALLPSVPLWGPSSAQRPHMGSGPHVSPCRLPQMALPAVWPWARHLPSVSTAYLYPSAPVSSPAQGAAPS